MIRKGLLLIKAYLKSSYTISESEFAMCCPNLMYSLLLSPFFLFEFLACLILTSSNIQIKLHVPEKIMHKLVQLTFFSKT